MTLLQMSVMGGSMVLAFALLRHILLGRLPNRAFLWMWTAAVCRLLLPVRIRSGWSIFHLLVREQTAWDGGMNGAADLTVPTAGIMENDVVPRLAAGIPLLPLIWLIGAILVGGYFLLVWIYWRKQFSAAAPVELSGWQETYPIHRTVCICEWEGMTAPLTYGIFRPVILLPRDLAAGEEQLRCIVTHEYVHIRRFDALRKLVLALTLTVHWFNPAVWLLFHLAGRDMELFCDQIALKQLGEAQRKTYAGTLLQAAERQSERIPLCSFFGKSMIEERILMMKQKKNVTVLAGILSVLLLLGVTTAFATTAEDPEAPYRGTAEAVEEPVPVVAEPIEAGSEALVWPAEGCDTVSGPFGKTNPVTGVTTDHITIAGEKGTNILAVAAGTVVDSGWHNQWGNYLEIDHGNGLTTMYTHLDESKVDRDMTVEQGQIIATMGQSGTAIGPCLGFYLADGGETVDPMEWFAQ